MIMWPTDAHTDMVGGWLLLLCAALQARPAPAQTSSTSRAAGGRATAPGASALDVSGMRCHGARNGAYMLRPEPCGGAPCWSDAGDAHYLFWSDSHGGRQGCIGFPPTCRAESPRDLRN